MWWLSGVDTVLPFGDMIYFGGLAILGFIAIATADDAPNISRSEVKDRTEEKDAVIEIQLKKQAYFTINPYDFTPIGLILVTYPGSKNGRIFKWKDPVSGMTVFEWDEDFAKGSHYHALMVEWNDIHLGPHYVPGTPVPEPWNSLYFGG